VRAAQKQLGALAIGGGIAQAGGGGGGSHRSQIHPHATRNVRKQQKMGRLPDFFAYKSCCGCLAEQNLGYYSATSQHKQFSPTRTFSYVHKINLKLNSTT
jgi:hypothetical protein